jgi:hypothetical protein
MPGLEVNTGAKSMPGLEINTGAQDKYWGCKSIELKGRYVEIKRLGNGVGNGRDIC